MGSGFSRHRSVKFHPSVNLPQVRLGFEEITGKPVVSSENFLDQPKGKSKKKTLPKAEQGPLFEQAREDQATSED